MHVDTLASLFPLALRTSILLFPEIPLLPEFVAGRVADRTTSRIASRIASRITGRIRSPSLTLTRLRRQHVQGDGSDRGG